jgi:hypothetical protein
MVQIRAESIPVQDEGGEGDPGFWRVNSPAACQDMHGPDEGGVDHVQDECCEGCPEFWRVNCGWTCMVHMRAESIMSKMKVVVKGAPDSGG